MNDLRNESPLFAALPQYKDPWPPLAGPCDGIIQVPDLTASWFELEVSELSALVARPYGTTARGRVGARPDPECSMQRGISRIAADIALTSACTCPATAGFARFS